MKTIREGGCHLCDRRPPVSAWRRGDETISACAGCEWVVIIRGYVKVDAALRPISRPAS